MNAHDHGKRSWFGGAALIFILMICVGCSSDIDTALEDIPLYPGASAGESMQQSVPGGFMGGALQQYSTPDTFEDVVDFYTDALRQHSTEIINHESELGRQTAFSIKQEKRITTVAIQEFNEEGMVNITFMAVGK